MEAASGVAAPTADNFTSAGTDPRARSSRRRRPRPRGTKPRRPTRGPTCSERRRLLLTPVAGEPPCGVGPESDVSLPARPTYPVAAAPVGRPWGTYDPASPALEDRRRPGPGPGAAVRRGGPPGRRREHVPPHHGRGSLDGLRDAAGGPDGPPAVWLLVPSDAQQSRPMVDGAPVPVFTAPQWARIPSAWLAARRAARRDRYLRELRRRGLSSPREDANDEVTDGSVS